MATCRMFYQDNNKTTTSVINPNHTKNQTQHRPSSVSSTDARTTDENSGKNLLIENEEEHPSTSMQVEKIIDNVPKNSNGKIKKECDDDLNTGGEDNEQGILTPISNNTKRSSESIDGGCFDETDSGGQNRTNRRSLSSSFVTEEEDVEDEVDNDQNNLDSSRNNARHQAKTDDTKEGDSSTTTAAKKSNPPCTYNNSKARNCTNISDRETGFNNSNNSGTFESDADNNYTFLTPAQLAGSTKEELIRAYHQLQAYVEIRNNNFEDEISQLKSTIEKYHTQQVDSSRRENILVMKLRTKDQEMEEYVAQINELKSAVVPTTGVLKTSLIDPSVNFIMQNMKKELQETKKKLQDAQDDLVAWKFTPDSNTGKRLMAKCKMLYVENEELGKMINGGRVAKLENDLALQKTLTEGLRKSKTEMLQMVHELDADVEGIQSTILLFQKQLRERDHSKDGESNCNLPLEHGDGDSSGNTATKCLVSVSELCSKCKEKLNSETINLRTSSRKTMKETTDEQQTDNSLLTSRRDAVDTKIIDDNNDDGENQRTHLMNGILSPETRDDNALSTNTNNSPSVLSTSNSLTIDESMETNESDDNNSIMTKKQLQLQMDHTNLSEHDNDEHQLPFKKSKLFHSQTQSDGAASALPLVDLNRTTSTSTTAVTSATTTSEDELPSSSSINGSNE